MAFGETNFPEHKPLGNILCYFQTISRCQVMAKGFHMEQFLNSSNHLPTSTKIICGWQYPLSTKLWLLYLDQGDWKAYFVDPRSEKVLASLGWAFCGFASGWPTLRTWNTLKWTGARSGVSWRPHWPPQRRNLFSVFKGFLSCQWCMWIGNWTTLRAQGNC